MQTESDKTQTPAKELALATGSMVFRVHDALGNWMIEDVQMGRMICMTTREHDARFIAEVLNAHSPNKGDMRNSAKSD